MRRSSANNQFKPDVVLANWAIVHRLWHHTFDEFEVFMRQLARQLDDMEERDVHRPRYSNCKVLCTLVSHERRYFEAFCLFVHHTTF